MKLGDKVFVKDIKCFGKIVLISNISISIYLDKTIEIEDKSCPFLNGDLTNSLKLPENRHTRGGMMYLIEEDFEITYPMYKTRLYRTNVDNIRVINRRNYNVKR